MGVIAFFHVVYVNQGIRVWSTGLSHSWIFFFSVLEMNVFAMKFGHPSVRLFSVWTLL